MSDSRHDQQSREAGVEPDLLPLGTLTAWVVGLTGLVIAVIAGLWQVFGRQLEAELLRKDLGQAHPALLESRAHDRNALSSYALLDEKTGTYRLTIERAMELLVEDPRTIAPLASPPASAAPPAETGAAPAPAAAPSGGPSDAPSGGPSPRAPEAAR